MFAHKLYYFALSMNEPYSCAYALDSLAGEYLEGEIDRSGDMFNRLIAEAPLPVLRALVEITVFNSIKDIALYHINRINTNVLQNMHVSKEIINGVEKYFHK